ncbi:MAG: hypothetical protein IKU62_01970 [Ruminiclostridium sp.]|nr:hypothetical protein [Ruminiclostridium sp.]
MKSNGTNMSACKLASIATAVGAVMWVLGMFTNYAVIPFRGLYVFFLVVSVAMLLIQLKLSKISGEVEGNPLKSTVLACIVCFALQVLFFGALVVLGPEALPWAQRVFLTMVALYILPVLEYYVAKREKI